MTSDDQPAKEPTDHRQTDLLNDLTIITGHAQIVRRRVRLGLRTTDVGLSEQMDAIIAAALRIGRRVNR